MLSLSSLSPPMPIIDSPIALTAKIIVALIPPLTPDPGRARHTARIGPGGGRRADYRSSRRRSTGSKANARASELPSGPIRISDTGQDSDRPSHHDQGQGIQSDPNRARFSNIH
eukprot:2809-Hanusia_phi.AAC.1